MTSSFTPEQSAEIDRRIVEMMTAVMGHGQYSRICQDIADYRARKYLQPATLRERVFAVLRGKR